MTYFVNRGTRGKLFCVKANQKPTVIDWTLRRDFIFPECLIDYEVVKSKTQKGAAGYALFAGETGGERNSQFVLAIPYNDVVVGSRSDPSC